MPKLVDLTGKRFDRLTVLERAENNNSDKVRWLCQCVCGNQKIIAGTHLSTGKTRSCGCLLSEHAISNNKKYCRTHGMHRTKTYNSWQSMFARCYDKNNPSYRYYGAKGIEVCEAWHKFENFFADMGTRPKGKTIDRKDNSKGYFKENCRWRTPKEQANNRTNNLKLTFEGQIKTATEWSKIIGLDRSTISRRYHNEKWPNEFILTIRALTPQEVTLFKYGKIDLRDKKYRL